MKFDFLSVTTQLTSENLIPLRIIEKYELMSDALSPKFLKQQKFEYLFEQMCREAVKEQCIPTSILRCLYDAFRVEIEDSCTYHVKYY
jgi:hypothetical protein